jgi:hypothetical protein
MCLEPRVFTLECGIGYNLFKRECVKLPVCLMRLRSNVVRLECVETRMCLCSKFKLECI